MPEYTIPMFGVMSDTLEREGGSMSGEEDFFSVARTMPFVAGVKDKFWSGRVAHLDRLTFYA